MAVDQPTRPAKHNQSLAEQADPATDAMLLPPLEDGITLLDVIGDRGVPVLQSLVIDHLLLHDGPAFWIDANGHATTTTLAHLAPSQRLLDRIHVARGFTAYQHYGAVADLPAAVDQFIQDAIAGQPANQDASESPHTPALIVAPAIDAQYRGDETLAESHTATLQARTLAHLSAYADGYDVPVLVTRSQCDDMTAPVATVADHQLECEQTRMGPRILGEDFETLVYPVDDGTYYQTTFAYWQQLLAARAAQVGVAETTTAPTPTGITTDGETVTTTDPLLDAWQNADTGAR